MLLMQCCYFLDRLYCGRSPVLLPPATASLPNRIKLETRSARGRHYCWHAPSLDAAFLSDRAGTLTRSRPHAYALPWRCSSTISPTLELYYPSVRSKANAPLGTIFAIPHSRPMCHQASAPRSWLTTVSSGCLLFLHAPEVILLSIR